MYLLNTNSISLSKINGKKAPDYAILSHRWEDELEISFQNLQELQKLPHDKRFDVPGYSKIAKCCEQAAKDGWPYVWIDSCCIDKTSSAELSEAINSMFRWYEKAKVCYAYLRDVPSWNESPHEQNSAFRRSEWFTRGWTLQELLAPKDVIFYDHDWVEIGRKSRLEQLISGITGIQDLSSFMEACVAQKMSWAAKRDTTRVEDEAYCLLGPFDVNMTPIYGEGEKAFLRLQLEILATSDDESIFAWTDGRSLNSGLLAPSPAAFANSGDVHRTRFDVGRPPYSMTNKGLCMEPLLAESPVLNFDFRKFPADFFLMPLNCGRRNNSRSLLAIILNQNSHRQFARVFPNRLLELEFEKLKTLHAKQYGNTLRSGIFTRELVYVRQQHYTVPSLLKHYSFSVTSRPPLKYIIWEGQYPTPYSDDKTDWDILHNGNRISDNQLRGFSKYNRATLVFTDQGRDLFVLLLHISIRKPLAKVLVIKDHSSSYGPVGLAMVDITELDEDKVHEVVKQLEWDKSVSIILGNGTEREKQYSLEIFIESVKSDE